MTSPSGLSTTSASTSPSRIARNVSSASSSRRRNSTTSVSSPAELSRTFVISFTSMASAELIVRFLALVNVQTNQELLRVRHVTDKSSQRSGQSLHQSRRRHDLLLARRIRVLININHFQI